MTLFSSALKKFKALKTLFISDLHLCASRPKTTAIFLKFLKEAAEEAEALYILGDFFEAWIGPDIVDQHDTEILKALAEFSRKKQLYFMPGNRDFLLNASITASFGCTFLKDPTVIELYGQRVLLMHGDSLCSLDKKYQYYRRFVQHPLIQKAFLSLPTLLRRLIAHGLRQKTFSRNARITTPLPHTEKALWDVVDKSVGEALTKHQSQILIHGHTHKPGIHDFTLGSLPAKRIVLGDWGDSGSVLIYTADDMRLQTIC